MCECVSVCVYLVGELLVLGPCREAVSDGLGGGVAVVGGATVDLPTTRGGGGGGGGGGGVGWVAVTHK